MLALVNSFPLPVKPFDVAGDRSAGWQWIDRLLADGTVRFAYPKLGRGMMALFSVESPEDLQLLLTAWGDFVPCAFEVTVLVDDSFQREMLRTTLAGGE